MRKTLGLALALSFALTVPAAAEMAKGTVKEVDKAGQTVVLADGKRIWVGPSYAGELVAGDSVSIAYDSRDGKMMATEVDRRAKLMDGTESSNFGARN